jgi:tRNA(Ile)-lysidine synthase TilS/MesJ
MAGVSGGKDSSAMLYLLKEQGKYSQVIHSIFSVV